MFKDSREYTLQKQYINEWLDWVEREKLAGIARDTRPKARQPISAHNPFWRWLQIFNLR